MDKKNILIITTVYRTGEKLYPIIPKLSEEYNVDVLHMYQMSNLTLFSREDNTRAVFDKKYLSYIRNEYNGPAYIKDPHKDSKFSVEFINDFESVIKKNNYCLAIWDNNTTIKGGGMSDFYHIFSKYGIKVIGSPHGNKEYKAHRLHKRMGRIYDYSFVFGKKEKEKFIKHSKGKFSNNFLPAGIPANDALINYNKGKKHILIIPNYTTSSKRVKAQFKCFSEDLFNQCQFLKLIDKYSCKIVVKEKQSIFYQDSYSVPKFLKKKDIDVIGFCEDDNELIANAKVVIGAPSTLAFKSIQLGIPTIVFKGYGAIGNFNDFPGLISPSYDSIRDSVKYQSSQGKLNKYIERTIAGGIDFRSIDLHIEYINKILE